MSIVLRSASGTQVISGNTEIAWRAYSLDEAPSDYFLWGICDQEIRRVKPCDLGELQKVVSDFVEFLDEEVVRMSGMSGPGLRCASNGLRPNESKYKRRTIEE